MTTPAKPNFITRLGYAAFVVALFLGIGGSSVQFFFPAYNRDSVTADELIRKAEKLPEREVLELRLQASELRSEEYKRWGRESYYRRWFLHSSGVFYVLGFVLIGWDGFGDTENRYCGNDRAPESLAMALACVLPR